ncbi:MAG TPA: hypothetical protein VLE51_01450 [Candidatus Saccharimonadales bacterium]|nr:hypothetical protein [Candidatus Saccharimonadales bacterium]
MSKYFAKLLAEPEVKIAKTIAKMEEVCGYPSEDVRLVAENKQQLRIKVKQLSLDPDDTTDEELYYALITKYQDDSNRLNKALGVHADTDFDERLAKARQLVSHCASSDEMWVIKNSVVKTALVNNPPKQVSKRLHFRSAASMIKREDLAEIYLAAVYLESATWRKKVSQQLSKTSTADYELRSIKIVKLSFERWGKINGPASYIVSDPRMGAVALWPSTELKNASVLSLTLLLLDGLQAINPSGYSELLHELSPALRWWTDNKYLISDGDYSVSFNLKDVALNHLQNNNLSQAVAHHGRESLWQELASRYKIISSSLSDSIPDIQYNFNKAKNVPALPINDELAAEYITVE